MAIEIIPKKVRRAFPIKEALFYLALLIFIGVIISYFVIFSLTKRANAEKQKIEDEIASIKVTDLEKELLVVQKKTSDIAPLLTNHVFPSEIFAFIEGKTHPKVFFTQFALDAKAAKVTASGQTDGFVELGQQILILAGESLIQTLELTQIEINKEGKVEFSLGIYLDPKIFAFSEEL